MRAAFSSLEKFAAVSFRLIFQERKLWFFISLGHVREIYVNDGMKSKS